MIARFSPSVAVLALTLALAPQAVVAQRPALAGEKARVAEAVRQDLTRLARLQKTWHDKTKAYAADASDLGFAATSGADVNIAFASMNAWAANASHAVLSPVKCFVIVSSADAPDAPTAQPFCTDAEPGTAAGRVAATTAAAPATPPSAEPAPTKAAPAKAATPSPTRPTTTPNTQKSSAPARQAPARQQAATPRRQTPPPRATPTTTPTTTPNRPSTAANPAPGITPGGGPAGLVPGAARLSTREVIAGASASDRAEAVSAQQFAGVLSEFAQSALSVLNAPRPEIVRDPYESTQEFEARRAAAAAAFDRREAEFFRDNTKTYSVQMAVTGVKYDPDREVLEFKVDPVRLPVMREGGAGSQLSLTCYTRPVFWCSPDTGMIYDAGDLWKVPRATARQHDVLRTPMTLTARFTVGRLEGGERELAISLVDMDLQARGQSVERWPGSSR